MHPFIRPCQHCQMRIYQIKQQQAGSLSPSPSLSSLRLSLSLAFLSFFAFPLKMFCPVKLPDIQPVKYLSFSGKDSVQQSLPECVCHLHGVCSHPEPVPSGRGLFYLWGRLSVSHVRCWAQGARRPSGPCPNSSGSDEDKSYHIWPTILWGCPASCHESPTV